ncbi:hypothetical protein [Methylobacterium sp. Leaf118]|uniref:hypothetical protein n=1 Tax=Methylobacterium sp. Leaf118 TaxID=2876562 RepID=UPI001E5DBB7C|nr:hypothetical protein [Methylobacterium sp. Leaf118]
MTDHTPSIGRTRPSVSKRPGHTLGFATRIGSAKASTAPGHSAARPAPGPTGRVVVPASDFEGFGSFSS